MEGDRFDAPGGKREAKVEEDQAAAAIQAKHRAAARRRKKKQEQEKAGSVEEQKAVKPLFGGKAGFGTPKEDDFAGSKDRNKSLEIRKKMQQRERSKRQAAAEQAAKAGMPADLRAALAIQRRWRERQFRLGKRSSARAKPKAGIKSDGTKANSRKTPEELEQERAAARIQASKRGADARRATRGQRGGVAASMSFLDSEASRKAEAEMALAKASSTIARFYRRFARKRNGRRWVKEETRRRHEAASKVQAARRGQRIRRHIGYRGTTEGEYGRPHGFGRMIWPDGSSFSGEWVEGVMEGEGEMVWHDGSCYEGGWSEGKRHGKGVYEDVSGSVFDGQWVHGVFQGEGTRTLPNGTLMEGQWEGGVLHGTGRQTQRSEDGTEWYDEYEGEWQHGERSGSGIEVSLEGRYEGMWRHNRRHGVGKLVDSHGWTYRGKWSDGQRSGQGVLSSTMGHRFSGEWDNHHLPHGTLTGRFLGTYVGHFRGTGRPEWPLNRHGKGVWEGLRGDQYDGQWVDDYYDGVGVLRTRFSVYEGRFRKGERHGHGVLVHVNGDWYEGEFHHDVFGGYGERSDHSGVYVGEFRDGKRHGEGTFTTHQGVRYVGGWEHGLRHGKGEQKYPDGSVFIGQFANDKKVGAGEFVDGFKSTTGGEIAYYGNYSAGVRHGDGAEWEGVYGDRYMGSFEEGEMRGVGKFNWADGEEYLGCWLAPGAKGQMPRKMAAVKRHGLTGQLSGGLADSLHKHAERDAYAGTAGAAGEGARSAAERIPTSELPNAVNALKGALLQGGLEMMNSKDGGGARRASGSLAQHKMGTKRASLAPKQDVRARMTSNAQGGGSEAVSKIGSNMISAATAQRNPFAEAGATPNSTRPAAMQPSDLSGRFAPKPPSTPGGSATPSSVGRGRVTGPTKAKKELDAWISDLDLLG